MGCRTGNARTGKTTSHLFVHKEAGFSKIWSLLGQKVEVYLQVIGFQVLFVKTSTYF